MSELLTQSVSEQTTAEAPKAETVDAVTSSTNDFFASLPDEFKSEASLQSFKDLPSLVKSYISAQKMIGSSIRIPGEDASDEVKSAFMEKIKSVPGVVKSPNPDDLEDLRSFHKSLGCPEKSADYKLSISDERKDMLQLPEVQSAIDLAHSLGANSKQVQAIVDSKLESIVASKMSEEKEISAAEKTLKETWGSEYQNRMKQADAAAKILSEKFPEDTKSLLSGSARNNPALLAMLSDLGGNLKEKGHVGMSAVKFGGLSADEARERIREVMSNPSHPYFNARDPRHKEETVKVLSYYDIAGSGRDNSK